MMYPEGTFGHAWEELEAEWKALPLWVRLLNWRLGRDIRRSRAAINAIREAQLAVAFVLREEELARRQSDSGSAH